jgi:hypothetical protein
MVSAAWTSSTSRTWTIRQSAEAKCLRVRATSVNPVDLKIRNGEFRKKA